MERSKAEKKTKDRRKPKPGRMGDRILYATGALGLAALVACAFYLPRLIFSVGDNRLCSDIVLGEREEMDVTLLSAAYETSLSARLQNFADGLTRGRNYYYSEQNMMLTQEMYQMLENDGNSRIFQMPCWAMFYLGLLSYDFSLSNKYYTVHSWKQYVIYSDDFAEGINFIVWYLEIEDGAGDKMNILMDAEDYTVYGLTTQLSPPETIDPFPFSWLLENELRLYEWRYVLRYYYHCVPDYVLDNQDFINLNYNKIYSLSHVASILVEQNNVELEYIYMDENAFEIPDADTWIMRLPCGTQQLDYSIRLLKNGDEYSHSYIGFDALCRLIPEFAETL